MAQKGDQDAKEVLYLRYKGFLVNESKKLVRNCGLNFDDTYGSLTYLFLCAINTYKHQGQFVGYMASYVRNKIKDDIGKRRGRMPYVPRNAPFYLRNMDERLLGDVDD
ncbi:MAG TPA: hypothetical protein PLO45_05810 [Defluviitoga sp.]|nr:hypothetical protein [Defluviitoga sp.]